jgi:hypothetical protein
MKKPHDGPDLLLAPIALELTERIAAIGDVPPDDIEFSVALASDRQNQTSRGRRAAVIAALTHGLDLHDWTVDWHAWGLALAHRDRLVVLGVPAALWQYVSEDFPTS